ncbi:MAG: hypothetical protein DRP74_06420 [Candidatus Omnitrophota bacterium]|nr:MAG: hypothetical protein DRP74_06420 [Candidatus Omnitrophota bacterium]
MRQVKRVFYNYTFLSFSQLLLLFVGVAAVAILARFLGPYEYGKYNLFIFTSQMLSLFASTWVLNPAAAKFASEEYLSSKSLKKTFSSELFVISINTLIVTFVLLLIRKKISVFLGLEDNFIMIFIFIYLVVFALFNLLYFCFQGSLNFRIYGVMPLLRSSVFIILLCFLVFQKQFRINLVLLSLVSSYAIVIAVVWRKLKSLCLLVFDKEHLFKILSFSWPVVFFAGGNFALDWIDKYLLRVLVSTYAVGIYSAAWNLTTNLVLVPQLLYTVVMPIITAYRLENHHANIKFYLNRLMPQLALFFSVLISFAVVLANFLLPLLYGDKYTASVNIFIILSLSSMFMGIKYFYNPVSTVFNFIKMTGSINLACAFLCVSLNYLFISKFGMLGAAVATTASSLIACIAVIFVINRQFEILNFKALYCSLPAIAVASACLISKNLFFNLTVTLTVFFISYGLLKKYKIFSKSDLEIIEKIDMPRWLKNKAVKFYGTFS